MPLKLIVFTFFISALIFKAHAGVHQYQIIIDENIENANVEICFDGKAPEYLAIANKSGNQDLVIFPQSKQGPIEIQGRYWKTKKLPKNACLSYQVNIKRHHAKRSKQSAGRKNIAFIEENTWLWLPELINQTYDVQLSFKLPSWAEMSTPWQQFDLSKHQYRLGSQPQEWGYTLLIGDFARQVSHIDQEHYLNIASTRNLEKHDQLIQWLTYVGKGLRNYLGTYPAKQTQIIVIAKEKANRGPVPWAYLSRGNGFGIRFVVNPSHDIKEFYSDWTATHEFSHQLLPKIHYDDIWLSEGLASYLQYLLLAKSGKISQEKAWLKMHKGFKRGEKGTNKLNNETLSVTSKQRKGKGRSGRTMRIYWSGALYFLKADVALREQSNGKQGLNDVLLKLNRCCIQGSKIWSGDELASKLDELSDVAIFRQLYQEFSSATHFPEYQSTFEQLGISFALDAKQPVQIKESSLAKIIMQ